MEPTYSVDLLWPTNTKMLPSRLASFLRSRSAEFIHKTIVYKKEIDSVLNHVAVT